MGCFERNDLMQISLFMSAARPKWWKRMYKSLVGNKCKWEIVAVGPNPPLEEMPINFRYYKCDFKPTQCYAAASYFSKGELIGWTADDAFYDENSLDSIWKFYKEGKTLYGKPFDAKKIIYTQKTIENGKDVSREHHLFRNCQDTPQMCPMAFLNREWFWFLKGYDRNYVSGQAENSIVCDALADSGRIVNVPLSKVYLNHEECHGGFINKIKYRLGKNSFRTGYENDRRYLEECWVEEGYGTYDEKTLKYGTVSPVRLLAHQPFNYDNILTVPAGPQGRWEK
jgi:hypothetical protein